MSMKTLAARMQYLGGNQLERINKNKLKSFQQALKNDYNTRMIKYNNAVWPCLINTLTGGFKADYDKEIISVDRASGLEAGETFEVLDDGTHWMIYMPYVGETAYLRSDIIRCRYQLNVNGKDYWCYVQGPTETDLRWFLKNNINANELNLSGTIYIKNDENTKNYFARFTRLKIDGHTWEVQVTDSLTVPGILELEIQEYYDNSIEELPEIRNMGGENALNVISGQTLVKQDCTIGYAINDLAYDPNVEWSIRNNPRVKIEEILEDGRMCKVKIFPGAVKEFDVVYGDQYLTVTIDWVKPVIQGPVEVYPYDTHTYWVKGDDVKATFSLDSDVAEIISSDDKSCQVEITTGRRGNFVLSCKFEDGTTSELEVAIKSL
jgi:hypothetical protein